MPAIQLVTRESIIINLFNIQAKHIDFLTLISKTDHGCSTVLHMRLLRVEEQKETLSDKLSNEFPHVCACALHQVDYVCTKQWRNKSMTLIDYPFGSQRYWSVTTNGFYFWAIIVSAF